MDQESRWIKEAMNAYYSRDAESLHRVLKRVEASMHNPLPSNIEVVLPDGDSRTVNVLLIDKKPDGTRQVCIDVSRDDLVK